MDMSKSLRFRPRTPFSSRRFSMSSQKYRDPIVMEAKKPSMGTVIFMHGLGDSGEGWMDGMAVIHQALPNVKFILPHAPVRPITCNFGMKMPGWYDIIEIGSIAKGEDESGMEESKTYILDLIKKEVAAGTPSEKIILGGFSQGGAMTYYTAFSSDIKLAGALIMSGYLPLASKFEQRLNKVNADIPTMACHGTHDQVIAFNRAKDSWEHAAKHGVKGSFHPYSGLAHSASMEELKDVTKWISSVLSETKL